MSYNARCSTIGCKAPAQDMLIWNDEDAKDEPVCRECADGYASRPAWVKSFSVERNTA